MLLISKTYWLGMPWTYRGELPAGASVRPVQLKAADLRDSNGLYYTPAAHKPPQSTAKIGVLVTHPRVDFQRHYCVPPFLAAGCAVLGLNGRCFNNDAIAIHEQLILDVNAGVKFLRDQGCEKVVLFGNSGGGSLSALFQAQAQLPKGQRLAQSPCGAPTKLNDVEMYPADAFIAVSAHKGQGLILTECIDPSVIDEADPLAVDASLDMYDTANGFRAPPQPAQYSPEFVARYRAAQLSRVKRLDDIARGYIADARQHEKQYEAMKGSDDFMARHRVGRRAALQRVMVIYRTMANLNYMDPSLDPSGRSQGSLLSDRPDLMNMQFMGFARVLTPEAWLSTWSGLSSNASMLKNLPALTDIPVLMVNASRDREIYPKVDAEAMWNAVAAKDKTFWQFDGEHYFEPPFGSPTAPDVDRLMAQVVPWVLERFGN
ncbi:MAG: alpha/beta hydrolase family protein [Gammaproteobacteria bacterium]